MAVEEKKKTKTIRTLDEVLKAIKKDFGEIVQKGLEQEESTSDKGNNLISLGSISLDFCIYGGLTEGRFSEFSGAESSGKTTIACLCAGSYQKARPGKSVLFVDMEGTFDPAWANKLGLRTDSQFIYYENLGQTGEEVLNHITDFIKTGEVGFVIIDSLPMLIPSYIQDEDSMDKKGMGGNAKLLSDFTGRYTGLVKKNKAVVVGINQIRDNMTGYGDPFKTTGGKAWKHACDLRLMFKRGDFFDKEGNEVKKKDAQSPAGHTIEMYVLKNKNSPWDRKLGFTRLHYWKGIDYIRDLTDVAVHFELIDNCSVGWFKILGEDGKPVLNENGEELKINGKAKLYAYMKEHKELTAKLYHKVRELMANKEPGYIKSFEEMLGADTTFLLEGDPEDN